MFIRQRGDTLTAVSGEVQRTLWIRAHRSWLKPDSSPVLCKWRHEFSNGIDHGLDVCIVPFQSTLKLGQLGGDLSICRHGLTHSHKSQHYEDAHLDGALRIQHGGAMIAPYSVRHGEGTDALRGRRLRSQIVISKSSCPCSRAGT